MHKISSSKIFLMILAFILPVACVPKNFSESAKTMEVDYFQKKKDCSQFIDRVIAKFEADDKEMFTFYARANDYYSDNLESVCYSASKNTCISFVTKRNYAKNGKDRVNKHISFSATDLLTGKEIQMVFGTPGDREAMRTYYADSSKLELDMGCVQ